VRGGWGDGGREGGGVSGGGGRGLSLGGEGSGEESVEGRRSPWGEEERHPGPERSRRRKKTPQGHSLSFFPAALISHGRGE
jgi:hypothetical protein